MEAIVNGYVTEERNNELFAQGYKYKVEGDFAITDGRDPWSGMPNTTSNTHFFTDLEQAEAYAAKQTWVFNEDIHGTVKEVKREETMTERMARYEREAAEKKAKKAAREMRKATEMGVTVEEYRAIIKRQARIKALTTALETAKAEVAKLENNLATEKAKLRDQLLNTETGCPMFF